MKKDEAGMKADIIKSLMEVITEYNRIVPELMQELEKSREELKTQKALREQDQDALTAGQKGID